MLKNKLKIIVLLIAIILFITIPVVRAENETATEIQPRTVSEDNFKKSDVYLVGDNITIDYVIDGNLFVIADSVTIDSQIGGDAFIIADSINVNEKGYIFSNLFALSQNINIKGVVYDVYALSEAVNVSGYIYRDIKLCCSDLSIFGVVGRNAFVSCSNITFNQTPSSEGEESTSHGSITGNLNYSSSNEISIPEGVVSGETTFTKTNIDDNEFDLQDKFISLGTIIVTAIIIWLLCIWLAPKFLDNTSKLISTKALPVIGFGILTPITIIVASIILFILGITATIGVLALGLLFALIAISTSIFIIAINNLICN